MGYDMARGNNNNCNRSYLAEWVLVPVAVDVGQRCVVEKQGCLVVGFQRGWNS